MLGKIVGDVVKAGTDLIGLSDSGAVRADQRRAEAEIREMQRRYQNINLPDIEKMRIALEAPELVGLLEAEELGDTAIGQIQLDPRLRETQMSALERISQRARQGLTAEDIALQEQQLEAATAAGRAQREQIQQEMQRRGTADSGTALMAQLQSAQGSGNQMRREALARMAQGSQQRMMADQMAGQMAGQIGQQDYGRALDAAAARDAIARANAMNRQQVNATNLGARQTIADRRVDTRNQQQMYNSGLEQQRFNNEITKAGGVNQASANLANMYQSSAQAKAQADAAVTGALIGGAASFFGKGK